MSVDRYSRVVSLGCHEPGRPARRLSVTARPFACHVVYVTGNERLLYTDVGERVVVANAKTKPVTVDVVVAMPDGWSITAENLRHDRLSSSIVRWRLAVPASGSTALEYSVRVKPDDG